MCCGENLNNIQLPYSSLGQLIGPQGPRGIQGPPGETMHALGVETDYAAILSNPPSPQVLDAYVTQDTNTFWIYDPTSSAANVDGWVDMGSIAGPTGPTGLQGSPGISGNTYYPYIGFSDDAIGTNFSTIATSTSCYVNYLFSTSIIGTLTAGSFTVGGSVIWTSGWLKVCGTSGITPSGTFLSGHGAPSSSSTAGTVYLDLDSSIFYQYTGTSWVIIPFAYTTTPWTSPTFLNGYTSLSPEILQYRQEGGNVFLKGGITYFNSTFVTTSTIFVLGLPTSFRPITTKYFPVWDNYQGIWCVGAINTSGNISIIGSKIPFALKELYFDNVHFSLT